MSRRRSYYGAEETPGGGGRGLALLVIFMVCIVGLVALLYSIAVMGG